MPSTADTDTPKTGGTGGGESDRLTYAASGVDIDAGDEVVRRIKSVLRRTHGPRVMGQHGAFAGMFRLDYNERLFKKNYRDPVLVACTDGVGTKVKLAAQLGIFDTVGIDCVAMNVNDLIVQGAEPLFFLDYLGLHQVVPEQTAKIVEGVAKGCEIAGCALLGGECSEMPDVYAEGDFDIAGFAVGVVELKRAIDPMRVEKGDVVVGLASDGIHSNGYSLVRKIVEKKGLELGRVYPELNKESHAEAQGAQRREGSGGKQAQSQSQSSSANSAPLREQSLGEILLTPTRIYARPIVKLLNQYKVKKVISGMAHITGGGLPGNVNRALPEDCDAKLDVSAWDVPPIFEFLQKHGNVDRHEMYRVFNMGIGYVLIVRPTFADAVVRRLNRYGENARVIGEIVKGKGGVRLG